MIEIIAPSSPPKNKQWKKGLNILENWGLRPRFSEKSLSTCGFHAHNRQNRSAFFMRIVSFQHFGYAGKYTLPVSMSFPPDAGTPAQSG